MPPSSPSWHSSTEGAWGDSGAGQWEEGWAEASWGAERRSSADPGWSDHHHSVSSWDRQSNGSNLREVPDEDISKFTFLGGDKKGKSLDLIYRAKLVSAISMYKLSPITINMWTSLTMDCVLWVLLKVSPLMQLEALGTKMSKLTAMLCNHFQDLFPQLSQQEDIVQRIKGSTGKQIIEWAVQEGFTWVPEEKEQAQHQEWWSKDAQPLPPIRALQRQLAL
jgi:hypothetical protein